MKTNSNSQSAFFHSRVLIGFLLCAFGALLALAGLSKSVIGMSAVTTIGTSSGGNRQHLPPAPALDDQAKANSGWRQYGFNPQHTSNNREETILNASNVSMLQVAWQYFFPCATY